MSRFESSRFVRNPQIMNANVLMAACETLGWKYATQSYYKKVKCGKI